MKRAKSKRDLLLVLSIILLFVMMTAGISSFGLAAEPSPASPPAVPAAPPKPQPAPAAAQPPAPGPVQPPATPPTLPSIANVVVTDVYRLGHETQKDRNNAGLEDIIIVKVRDLQSLNSRAKCLDKDGRKVPDCREQEISLYLGERRIKGISPEVDAVVQEEGTLQFHLTRNSDNDEAWADLFGAPPLDGRFFKRPTEVSVGLENGYPVPIAVMKDKFNLIPIRETRFWLGTVGLFLLACVLIGFAKKTDIVRDSGPAPGTDAQGRAKLRPYSLGRCQMAFWFFWVIASFLYIWLITGTYDIITSSVLGLIGIGAGTALGGAAIDVNKREETSKQLSNLRAEKPVVENEINELAAKIAAAPAPAALMESQQVKATKEARLNLINSQIPDLVAQTRPQESNGFLDDILTDANGLSFHRFQMAVWTIVLGIIFIVSVWTRLAMPEFSATLLALLGISNGTYIGFKIPEKQT
jgi:hypothetical protein